MLRKSFRPSQWVFQMVATPSPNVHTAWGQKNLDPITLLPHPRLCLESFDLC